MSDHNSPLQPLLKKLAYWADFTAEDEQAILGLPHKVKSVERHGYIAREREKTTHSCVLLEGFAIRHKIVAGGGAADRRHPHEGRYGRPSKFVPDDCRP